jgi:CRISPR-associated protein Cas5d
MEQPKPQTIRAWGDFACFTRPELKAERFSYPFITPSAARGIFDAIYAKPPEFRWQVTRIEILRDPKYIALRRNEVTKIAGRVPIDVETARAQRQTMALRNPEYRLTAEIRPWPQHAAKQNALEEQWLRRVRHGKCFYQPYFGCREFACFFLPEDEAPPAATADYAEDVGFMLYDVFDLSQPQTSSAAPAISLFHPEITGGVVEVPEYSDARVLKVKEG